MTGLLNRLLKLEKITEGPTAQLWHETHFTSAGVQTEVFKLPDGTTAGTLEEADLLMRAAGHQNYEIHAVIMQAFDPCPGVPCEECKMSDGCPHKNKGAN